LDQYGTVLNSRPGFFVLSRLGREKKSSANEEALHTMVSEGGVLEQHVVVVSGYKPICLATSTLQHVVGGYWNFKLRLARGRTSSLETHFSSRK